MSTTMKSILQPEGELTAEQKQILSGYQEVRALDIFPDNDFNLIEGYKIKHLHK